MEPTKVKRVSILSLTEDERLKFACILKEYFPDLGSDEEWDLSAADVVQELCQMSEMIGHQNIEIEYED